MQWIVISERALYTDQWLDVRTADDFESTVIQWVPLDDVPGLIAKQDIVSASTMAALLILLTDGADPSPDAHR
jgi:hypothetical protein